MRRRTVSVTGRWGIPLLLAALVLSPPSWAGARCNGVVQARDDFYLVSRSGQVIHRYIRDGQPKAYLRGAYRTPFEPVASPDGKRIAYVSGISGEREWVTVANARGVVGQFDLLAPAGDLYGASMIQRLAWADNALLRVERHLNPRVGLIDHYRIPVTPAPGPTALSPALDRMVALRCALAAGTNTAACLRDSTVSINDAEVYTRSWHKGLAPIGSLPITVGATAAPAEPDIRIHLARVVGDESVLGITYGGGTMTGQFAAGKPVVIVSDEIQYALVPTPIPDGVRMDILKNPREGLSEALEPVIAWRVADAQIAVVEDTASGRRLSLLERTGKAGSQAWDSVATAALPIEEDLWWIRFISPEELLIRTDQSFLRVPIAVGRPAGHVKLAAGSVTRLPEAIGVVLSPGTRPVESRVLDWACPGS